MNKEIQLNTDSVIVDCNKRIVINSIMAFMASVSIVMGVCSEFHIKVSLPIMILVCAATSVLLQFIMSSKRRLIIGGSIFIAGCVVVCLCLIGQLTNGFAIMANQLLTTVNKNMAMANLMFVANKNSSGVDVIVASAVFAVTVTFVMSILIRVRFNILAVVLIFYGIIIGMLYRDMGNPVWIVLGIAAATGILSIGNIRGNISFDMYIYTGLKLILLGGLSICIFLFFKYTPLGAVDNVKNTIVYNGGNVLYGKSDYPEGEFDRFDDVVITGEPRLKVTTDYPVRLYLRGYVASKYTSEGWKENDQYIYGGDYEGVFDWFVKNQYSPLTNLAAYIEESRNQDSEFISQNRVSVSIENDGARRKYQYLPDSLTYSSLPGLYVAKNDVNFIAQGIKTKSKYSFEIEEVPEGKYKNLYGASWYKNKSGDEDFLKSENVYGTFARKYYMDVPDDISTYFDNNVMYAGKTLNPFDALTVVRKYLENQISYNEEAAGYSGNDDFVINLLENSKEGYSVHYASAAVLLFRYYGIPARYVEGYLSYPAEDGSNTVTLTDGDAHAWVEVYISGLGFIPFEVTPGFYEDEEAGANGGGGGGGSSSQNTPDTSPEADNEKQEDDQHPIINITWIVYLVVIIFILFIIAVIVRRFIICNKRKKDMFSEDFGVSIAASSTLMQKLMSYKKQNLDENISEEVKNVLLKYKFSPDNPTAEDAALIRGVAFTIQEKVYSEEKAFGKIRLMFVFCLK